MPALFVRLLAVLLSAWLSLFALAAPAHAEVDVHFHSFNGSVLIGRYPHAFVVFEGTLEDTGEVIEENFGFSARSASPAVLLGPVTHMILVEKPRQVERTNRHFTITVSDNTYRRMRMEVEAWRDAPGKFYDLDMRNCIHFVGRMAELAGLKVDYPQNMLRKPKAWLNHLTQLNPRLDADPVR